jgi:hypothetical protein
MISIRSSGYYISSLAWFLILPNHRISKSIELYPSGFPYGNFSLIGLTYPAYQDSVKLPFIIWVNLCGIDVESTCHVMCHPFTHYLLSIYLIQLHVQSQSQYDVSTLLKIWVFGICMICFVSIF